MWSSTSLDLIPQKFSSLYCVDKWMETFGDVDETQGVSNIKAQVFFFVGLIVVRCCHEGIMELFQDTT